MSERATESARGTSLPVRQGAAGGPRRRWWPVLLAFVLFMVLSAVFYDMNSRKRASANRIQARANLDKISHAYRVYHASHGEWPTLGVLVQNGITTRDEVIRFNEVSDRGDWPRVLVVQKHAAPAVKKGAPFGGPGEYAKEDLPAVRLLLYENMVVREMPDELFWREIVPRIEGAVGK